MDLGTLMTAGSSAVVGALAGLFGGIWRAEQIKKTVKQEVHKELAEIISASMQSFSDQFRETLNGLRTKINSVELDTERFFLKKESFDDFRVEYRQDMERVLNKLDRL